MVDKAQETSGTSSLNCSPRFCLPPINETQICQRLNTGAQKDEIKKESCECNYEIRLRLRPKSLPSDDSAHELEINFSESNESFRMYTSNNTLFITRRGGTPVGLYNFPREPPVFRLPPTGTNEPFGMRKPIASVEKTTWIDESTERMNAFIAQSSGFPLPEVADPSYKRTGFFETLENDVRIENPYLQMRKRAQYAGWVQKMAPRPTVAPDPDTSFCSGWPSERASNNLNSLVEHVADKRKKYNWGLGRRACEMDRKGRQDPVNDARFYESLIKPPQMRTTEDIRNIYEQLRQLEMFSNLYNAPLKAICATARYERHPAHHILFRDGQVASCWYILLSGSVFIENHIYLPYGCFGKRNGLNYRRTHDCMLLQESEMIVIDYPDVTVVTNGHLTNGSVHAVVSATSSSSSGTSHEGPGIVRHIRKSAPNMDVDSLLMPPPPVPPRPPRLPPTAAKGPAPLPPRGLPRTYPMDFPVDVPTTSSTYSNDNHRSQVYLNGLSADDDTLVRVKHRREKSNSIAGAAVSSGTIRRLRGRSTASSTTTEGETASNEGVDSEDEDGSVPSQESSNGAFLDLRDSVRECLEKEPSERNSEDLAVLLDFMQHMSAFASLPMSIKRQLCLKMVFAVVNDAGTVVLGHNEKLDSWSVIVNGVVEVIKPNGERVEFKLGDAFGAEPTPTSQFHVGEMRTMVDDCEFVLVEHRDFCSIMSTIGDHIEKDRDGLTGEVVSETERRTIGSQVGLVLIKGKPDKLIQHLVDDRDQNVDPHYVEDFLLTYRVFIRDPTIIFEKLMLWFADSVYRDKVARLVLLWVNNHYNDFETNEEMSRLLERFEGALERDGMHSQLSLLNIACSVKAKPRTIQMTRAKDDPMQFLLIGGKECGSSLFVAEVFPDTNAKRAGVKRADEMLEINQQSVKYLTVTRAQEILTGSLSLTLLLKSNILGFKGASGSNRTSRRQIQGPCGHQKQRSRRDSGAKSSMMDKLMTILKSNKDEDFADEGRQITSELRPSRSNPDITSISQYYGPVRSECPEHVLKIYRSDQTFKYLPVYKETSAQNVVQLALQEFNMTAEGSLEWSLCECTVTPDGVIKQKRLPPQLENLAERIALNSRYYLKNNNRSDPLVPDELAPELLKDAQTQLLLLNAQVVAAQLTLQDFAVFSAIEPTEYIDNLFHLDSKYGSPRLEEFERLFNREMWWVATEVCSERHVQRRAKIIKKFIKIARHCRDLRNFNSMFAIVSGLDKPAVRRLHGSWERISSKYHRMLDEIHQLMDPTRNMSKYRQHLAEVEQEPPVVPIYPVIKKDLTFSHEGNPTYTDKLVNFEKLRLIAKSVRTVTKLSSAPYEIASMAERSGGAVNDALLHMNTFEGGGSVATMRKGMAHRANQPRKKVYEQALMVRKVKAYIEGMQVVDNEMELDAMSSDLEPQVQTTRGSTAALGTMTNARRAPSPTPSSLSSQSTGSADQHSRHRFMLGGSGGPKFGVESPQAVQKMLSLVQNSKVKGMSPSTSPALSGPRGLQRNVPRVTARHGGPGPIGVQRHSDQLRFYLLLFRCSVAVPFFHLSQLFFSPKLDQKTSLDVASLVGAQRRSCSEARLGSSTFYIDADPNVFSATPSPTTPSSMTRAITVKPPTASISVVIPSKAPKLTSPRSSASQIISPSGVATYSPNSRSLSLTSVSSTGTLEPSSSSLSGFVLGHRPVPAYSTTLSASSQSLRGLPPRGRTYSNRMEPIREGTQFSSDQVSRYFPEIVQTSRRLIDTARILNIPTLVTEQYPKGLGHTVPQLKEGLSDDTPILEKTKFSMCLPDSEGILKNIKNVILVGIEAHVCVLQTTYDLLERGHAVHVVVDAVSSRSLTDRKFAFKQLESAGAVLTTSECVILGLVQGSDHPKFKEVQKLIMTSAPDTGLVRPRL
ncbi:unnamed protein product [Caenorhabditis auriculariae]|uniref:Uncharacterized protein n=1 Tax=Caenorhabditis auriculariae TaxID=2777116 RepID=A0A8S1HH57_9PELO|nr:unnamed protein product [Caenorhabditis auriculariae]